MPADPNRPYPPPLHRRELTRLIGVNLTLSPNPAGAQVHRRQRVRVLVRVHPNHDHVHRPLRSLSPTERISGGQTSVRGDATLLSSHAEDPRAATGDKTTEVKPGPTGTLRVSPPPARGHTGSDRTTPTRDQAR